MVPVPDIDGLSPHLIGRDSFVTRLHARCAVKVATVLLLAFLLGCSDSNGPSAPEVKIVPIPTDEMGPFVPALVQGDREFNQNGPLVTVSAEIHLNGTDSLMCKVYMRVEETEPDWSMAEDEWERLIYRAPDGWRITGVCADPVSCVQQYIDYDDDWDWLFCSSFVFRAQGDTPGEDIGGGTEVWVQLRCGEIQIEEE